MMKGGRMKSEQVRGEILKEYSAYLALVREQRSLELEIRGIVKSANDVHSRGEKLLKKIESLEFKYVAARETESDEAEILGNSEEALSEQELQVLDRDELLERVAESPTRPLALSDADVARAMRRTWNYFLTGELGR
jgi:hypothetical protein